MRAAVALVLAALAAGPGWAECRQALALGLDISGSVDAQEYRLQLDGVASALDSPDVQAAFLTMPGTWVDLAIYEWSGPRDTRVTVPFTAITGPGPLSDVADRLRSARRPAGNPSTALGGAMSTGAAMVRTRPCWRRVVDISGDGKSNTGPRPRDVKLGLGDVVVNALVIGTDDPGRGDRRSVQIGELGAYFRAEVIHGPDAFLETALGFRDYARAMERKLIRELRVMVLGDGKDVP
ncbi:hypothetical protein PAA8504_02708 [Palleronia abyssalis]|uniref:VWFA domain-containing protein n=1 Tax=Palleronia abyssalis TaxID=1501240 RepID=A0A2R8BXF7_9RHOB|nr:hypothetical protein PAA8504_02708 [Palleronia abyssalis]